MKGYIRNKLRDLKDTIDIHICFSKETWNRYKHITTDSKKHGKHVGDILTFTKHET